MADKSKARTQPLTARIGRVASVGANMTGAVAADGERIQAALAKALRTALGRSKRPADESVRCFPPS
ncbi:MAG: hypothetical protein R3C16_12620 [Hyphomonadaceae bacterium]